MPNFKFSIKGMSLGLKINKDLYRLKKAQGFSMLPNVKSSSMYNSTNKISKYINYFRVLLHLKMNGLKRSEQK